MSENIFQKIANPSPRGRLWQIFVLIIVLVVGASFIDFGASIDRGSNWLAAKTNNFIQLPKLKETPFHLGLDLQGGTHLVYKADTSNVPAGGEADAAAGVRDVIERRVNAFGVSEPLVAVNKAGDDDYRVIVELAGVKDVKEAIEMIGETPILEFKEQNADRDLTEDENKMIADVNAESEKSAEEVLGKVLSGGDFVKLAEEYDKSGSFSADGKWVDLESSPEVAQEVSKLKVGTVSDLIETSYGYHVVKLLEEKPAVNELTGEEKTQVKASHLLICYSGAEGCDSELSKEEAYEKIKALKDKATAKNFSQLVKENSTEPGADQTAGELGWFGKGMMVQPFEDTVFPQEVGTVSFVVETKFGYHLIYKEEERKLDEYKVLEIFTPKATKESLIAADDSWTTTELTGKYLKNSSVQLDQNTGRPIISLKFDSEGSKIFEEVTARNVGKPLAIFLDGRSIADSNGDGIIDEEDVYAPVVQQKISGGEAVINGRFNILEAKQLSQRLNAGALPVPITLVSQQIVGATLGKASVAQSLTAGLWGILLVALFMILYYRLPGLVSVLALAVYSLALLAFFKCWGIAVLAIALALIVYVKPKGASLGLSLLGFLVLLGMVLKLPIFWTFPVTLTLPGIAGLVLSIGMAVDANVLIFERFKEELKDGKSGDKAVEVGFQRAWSSIRDGNLSTILTCLILYFFSTGMVKGFAITLILGILISMFSAITVTRSVLLLLPEKWLVNPFLSGVKKNKE